VPELAIIDKDLWERVQERLAARPVQRPEQMHGVAAKGDLHK
jgi:hypothetical protein